MIEFSNLIQVKPIHLDKSDSVKVYEFIANPFSYIPQLTDNETGTYWNCDKTIVIDLPDSDALRFFSIERSAVVNIRTSDRRDHKIGTSDIPARVQISSNLNSANLIIRCKMLIAPFL
ncbi:hypothetical protein [Prevotella sp. HUN102]|uniref:hypothetical protein n=1 Tax=Prevotella sp. HUN102 TaxID=1392486 RepID=UPI00048F6E0B|nr:hypothetical protein [Prevotella sp. HUN102]